MVFGVLFEVLVMDIREIDGRVLWECCLGGLVTGRYVSARLTEGSRCAGATVQSLARVSLSGVYAGVFLLRVPLFGLTNR